MQELFYENLKKEIDDLNGCFNLSDMQDKIGKFLLGSYIDINMALELKDYAALKYNPNYTAEPTIQELQKQIVNLTIDSLFE